jgi:3',5'-cyclic AMP phosphodiesterase CpdA
LIVVQITDTHIKADGRLAYAKVDSAARLAACVEHVNALVPRPDVALLTGDLVDLGRADEYRVLRRLLDRLAMPYFVIPGNHDSRSELREAFRGHAYLPGGEFLHYVVEDYPVRLVGLDSIVPGAPHGEMCEHRLAWLDARLAERPERPTVIFMHHPPFLTGIVHMDAMNCRNGDALGAVVARHPQVQRLICGHVHRAVELSWYGTTASIGPSPSHAVALDLGPDSPAHLVLEPPACQLLVFTAERRIVGHLTYIGSYEGPHPFFGDDGQLID